jgi:hypothetical protein
LKQYKRTKHNRTSIPETSSSQQSPNTNRTRKKTKRKKSNRQRKTRATRQKLINNIKIKKKLNNLVATKADKGNTLIIINKDEYDQKIDEFIATSSFTKLTKGQTNQQQKP